MKGAVIVLFGVLALSSAAGSHALAQEGSGASHTTPGFVADWLGNLAYTENQLNSLEGAVPQEKFIWRPGEGVRSIGEVYRHVAFGNYIFGKLMGFEPPAEAGFHMDIKKWDTESTDKAEIAAVMKASFDYLRDVASKITTADLEKKMTLFGTEMSMRAAMIALIGHIHEHLGQSVAYARMNDIVPPWTAAEQAAETGKK